GISNEVDIGVEFLVDVELIWNGCFVNVSRGKNDMFANGVDLVVINVGMDDEVDVGMIGALVGIIVNGIVDVGMISME
ncbi:hypothetical protein KI387_036962, partial [Taxus chinensis]